MNWHRKTGCSATITRTVHRGGVFVNAIGYSIENRASCDRDRALPGEILIQIIRFVSICKPTILS